MNDILRKLGEVRLFTSFDFIYISFVSIAIEIRFKNQIEIEISDPKALTENSSFT